MPFARIEPLRRIESSDGARNAVADPEGWATRGVVDPADVTAGRVPVIAPEGFMEEATSENVMAGGAMMRVPYHSPSIAPTTKPPWPSASTQRPT